MNNSSIIFDQDQYFFPLDRLAGELLAAAEQYQLELLKSICEEKLCSCLEIGNSVNYLVLGDMYQVCVILTTVNKYPSFKFSTSVWR